MICGYESACNNKGGIKAITLVSASQIAQVKYDRVNDRFTDLVLEKDALMCEINLCEDTASYIESFYRDKGCCRVVHELSFVVYSAENESYEFLTKLLQAKIGGVVAIVTDNASRRYLVGYSYLFGSERALLLSQGISDSASSLSDQPLTAISLSCEDTAKALILDGQIQTLLA